MKVSMILVKAKVPGCFLAFLVDSRCTRQAGLAGEMRDCRDSLEKGVREDRTKVCPQDLDS